MSDIEAFLKARLDEDELKVTGMQREMMRARTAPIFAPHRDAMLGHLAGIDIFVSPERATAELAVKRKILAEHAEDYRSCRRCVDGFAWQAMGGDSGSVDSLPMVPYPCPTLRLLAEPFSDSPDYDPSWQV